MRERFGRYCGCLHVVSWTLFWFEGVGGGRGFPSFTSPQSDTRDRQRLMEGEGGFASVPEEQTCVFFYTAT